MLDSGSKQTLIGFSCPWKRHSLGPTCSFLNTRKTSAIHDIKAWRAALRKMEVFCALRWPLTPKTFFFFFFLHRSLISWFGWVGLVACRVVAPATAWSRGSSCRRGTGRGSRPRRLWQVGPCSGCGSPSGRCSLWMGRTNGEGRKETQA